MKTGFGLRLSGFGLRTLDSGSAPGKPKPEARLHPLLSGYPFSRQSRMPPSIEITLA